MKEEEDAGLAIPSAEETVDYQEVVRTNVPSLASWMGCRFKFKKIVISFYNGWLHDHFVGFWSSGSLLFECSRFLA